MQCPRPRFFHHPKLLVSATFQPTLGLMTDFSPREIVSELDRFIVGQTDAKRAVSIALRNRWRRLQLTGALREEVLPKNILMIGPTGVGKTEIARRLAKLAGAPFIKVEATKFTEVGYVGRDVEQIIRDLVEVAIAQTRERKRKDVQAGGVRPPRTVCSVPWSAPAPVPRPAIPFARSCAPENLTTRKSRSRRSPRAECRCLKFRACPGRKWAPSRLAISSARWAAGPRPAA